MRWVGMIAVGEWHCHWQGMVLQGCKRGLQAKCVPEEGELLGRQ
jgi:hypothetical protein